MKYESKKYSMGYKNLKWELTKTTVQENTSYKFILSDTDDEYYIGTNFLSASSANEIESEIDAVIESNLELESIDDIYKKLQSKFYGNLYYELLKISPKLHDGIILISI